MKKAVNNQRGIALLITITLIGLIVILTLNFNKSMRGEIWAAANLNNNMTLEYIAESGFNCALAALREDDPAADSFHDIWASLQEYSSYSGTLFENGGFEVEITDLSGKIQINSLVNENGEYNIKQKELFIRFLTSNGFDVEPDEAEDIADSIKDWIDRDDEVTRFGAEDAFYRSLESPYPCRNYIIESLDELLFIKGISRDLLYGSEDNPGIALYLTVHGKGRININTADPVVLKALSIDMDQEMIEEFSAYRADEENDLSDAGWYKTALGTNENILDPDLITTKSSYFEIRSRGISGSMTEEIIGAVKRENNNIRILSLKSP